MLEFALHCTRQLTVNDVLVGACSYLVLCGVIPRNSKNTYINCAIVKMPDTVSLLYLIFRLVFFGGNLAFPDEDSFRRNYTMLTENAKLICEIHYSITVENL